MGPCDGYGQGNKRAKKAKKGKGRKGERGGYDDDAADDEIEADDRASEREEIDERDERRKRNAQRRERKPGGYSETDTDDSQGEDSGAPEDEGGVNAGDAAGGKTDVEEGEADPASERRAEDRSRREVKTDDPEAKEQTASDRRAEGRSRRGLKADAQAGDTGEEKRGFFRGVQQFFGFGGDESEE
jgi:hypothetical protein